MTATTSLEQTAAQTEQKAEQKDAYTKLRVMLDFIEGASLDYISEGETEEDQEIRYKELRVALEQSVVGIKALYNIAAIECPPGWKPCCDDCIRTTSMCIC